jgi:hypothetical protein
MSEQETPEPAQHHSCICLRCPDKPEFSSSTAFVNHAKAIHRLADGTRFLRRMTLHLDAPEWFQSEYTWIINDEAWCAESIRYPRDEEDRAFWGV